MISGWLILKSGEDDPPASTPEKELMKFVLNMRYFALLEAVRAEGAVPRIIVADAEVTDKFGE